jgi:hypothetical protein
LELLDMEALGATQEFIAENELLDPERADAMHDPIARRGLAKSWEEGRRMLGWGSRPRQSKAG